MWASDRSGRTRDQVGVSHELLKELMHIQFPYAITASNSPLINPYHCVIPLVPDTREGGKFNSLTIIWDLCAGVAKT